MKNVKVLTVSSAGLEFEGGITLSSDHSQDCCESHDLTFDDLTLADFDGLLFDLSGDDFFKRIEGFGIELIPTNGHPVRIPGHGYNNGYYGTNLDLCIDGPGINKRYDITECQEISD